jgi:CubicO group peptidase (beta-lactamase class C family)
MVPGKRIQQGTRDVLIAREDEEIVCPKGTVCGRITRDANDNITDGDFALGRARLAAPAAAHAATVHARETASAHLRSFYTAMTERDGPHGGRFHYVSPNTDLLGWVIERATGRRYADLISELIWRPMGAARSAYIKVHRLGAPRSAGGICATLRDLALVGQLIANGGTRGGKQVLPRAWLDDITASGDRQAWSAGDFAAHLPGARYRSKWYVDDSDGPLLFGLGIRGQYLFVDAERQLVIAKVSAQDPPRDAALIASTLRAVSAVRRTLAG